MLDRAVVMPRIVTLTLVGLWPFGIDGVVRLRPCGTAARQHARCLPHTLPSRAVDASLDKVTVPPPYAW